MKSSPNHSPQIILSEQKDIPMLEFLWRWKVSTTATMARRFYGDKPVHGAYQRLLRLRKWGFIRTRTDESGNFFVWTLDKKGYAAIRHRLPELREDGYLSENLRHDLVVAAIHFGDGILGEIPGLKTFTEQELRRLHPDLHPSWVPKAKSRRPDGYWLVETAYAKRVVALEVEISVKADAAYEEIGWFYDDHSDIDEIVWIVRSPGVGQKLHQLFQRVSRRGCKHSFALLESFYSLGWHSPIILGLSQDKSIATVLGKAPGDTLDTPLAGFLLDARKAPHFSKRSELFRP